MPIRGAFAFLHAADKTWPSVLSGSEFPSSAILKSWVGLMAPLELLLYLLSSAGFSHASRFAVETGKIVAVPNVAACAITVSLHMAAGRFNSQYTYNLTECY